MKLLLVMIVALATALPGIAHSQSQGTNDSEFCLEITTMQNDVFDTVSRQSTQRIKDWIRPAAKLYKAECLRTIVTLLGGLRRLSVGGFLNGLWGSILDGSGDQVLGRLCSAVIENLPDNWNGNSADPSTPFRVELPVGPPASTRRSAVLRVEGAV